MANLNKLSENEINTIYGIQDNNTLGIVLIPKNLKNDIDFYMTFNTTYDNNFFISDKTISMIKKNSAKFNNEKLILMYFVDRNMLINKDYNSIFENIKLFVNTIYNNLMENENISKERFNKKIFLLHRQKEHDNLINWLGKNCSSKFISDFYENKTVDNVNNSINDNIFYMEDYNYLPKFLNDNDSTGNGPVNFGNSSEYEMKSTKHKTLVKKPFKPHNAAFISLNTTILILCFCFITGIMLSILLIKK